MLGDINSTEFLKYHHLIILQVLKVLSHNQNHTFLSLSTRFYWGSHSIVVSATVSISTTLNTFISDVSLPCAALFSACAFIDAARENDPMKQFIGGHDVRMLLWSFKLVQ